MIAKSRRWETPRDKPPGSINATHQSQGHKAGGEDIQIKRDLGKISHLSWVWLSIQTNCKNQNKQKYFQTVGMLALIGHLIRFKVTADLGGDDTILKMASSYLSHTVEVFTDESHHAWTLLQNNPGEKTRGVTEEEIPDAAGNRHSWVTGACFLAPPLTPRCTPPVPSTPAGGPTIQFGPDTKSLSQGRPRSGCQPHVPASCTAVPAPTYHASNSHRRQKTAALSSQNPSH